MKQQKKTIQQAQAEKTAIDHRAALEQEEIQKDIACQAEVNAALKKYGRALQASATFIQGKQPVWNVSIVRVK